MEIYCSPRMRNVKLYLKNQILYDVRVCVMEIPQVK